MNDEADVALVDTHAERDGGDHDVDLVPCEGVLMAAPHAVVEARVVRDSPDAWAARRYSVLGVDVLAAERVDDARSPRRVGARTRGDPCVSHGRPPSRAPTPPGSDG